MAEYKTTSCPLDCPDTCTLEVSVDEGRVTKIGASDANPLTQNFICGKVRRFASRLYHADRLLHPMRRVGPKGSGQFERIEWDEALTEINANFQQIVERYGGEAIWPYHYGGSNGVLTDGFTDDLYFARLGASRNGKTLCAVPTTEVATGMYGKMPGVAYQDYPKSRCIVVWGANPKASSIHFVPFLREAKRQGAFIAVVDPQLNFSEQEIDLHLAVRPGTDLPVALAMINTWNMAGRLDTVFLKEQTHGLDRLLKAAEEWSVERAAQVAGIDPSTIEELAERFYQATPAVIRMGWGLERNRNGGQAIAAILAMPALLGKFGVRGGGYTMSNNGAIRSRVGELVNKVPWNTRTLNMSQLGRILNEEQDPPIKGLFVYNCNPVATVPNQNAVVRGVSRDDVFTVVFEQVMTDTAKYADILLPATTFLEHDDIRISYGTYVVGGVRPVVSPEGEARSNQEVFAQLGSKMGWYDDPFHWKPSEHIPNAAAMISLGDDPLSHDVIAEGKTAACEFPGGAPVQFDSVFPRTSDKKVNLTPAQLGEAPFAFESADEIGFPLAFISPAAARLVSSTFGESYDGPLKLTINPEDAAPRDIGDGDDVRVFNDLGEVICKARVSRRICTGVVSMPKGIWRKNSSNGATATAVCPDNVNVVGGGACFNDARVEVERASTA